MTILYVWHHVHRGIDGKISLPCNYVSDVHNLFKFPSLHVTRASLLYPPAPHVLFRTVLPPPPSFFGRYTIFYHMHINDDIRSKLSLIICRNSTYLANRRQTEIPSRSLEQTLTRYFIHEILRRIM